MQPAIFLTSFLLNKLLLSLIVLQVTLIISTQCDREPAGVIFFCFQGFAHIVSTEVCPGGIRFLEGAFRPDDDCICSEGIFLAPGARYGVGSRISTPVLVSPRGFRCKVWKQGYFYDADGAGSSEKGCRKEPWRALHRWLMVPLADSSHLERESLAMWRGVDDDTMYNLQDFRLFTRDSSGNTRIPLERDYQGYFAYYKGFQNGSSTRNDFKENKIQIGQYCMSIGGIESDDYNESLVYISKHSLRFDNTSIKYGCSRNSIKMDVIGIGDTESPCSAGCYSGMYSEVLRYEDLLLQNNRPLPPQEKIIHHFKNSLKTDFSDLLELRLKNFRNYENFLGNRDKSNEHYLEFLSKAIAVAQKLIIEPLQKRLLEDTMKMFVIGTGGNFMVQSLKAEVKELIRILNACLEKSSPIMIDVENCTKNSTIKNEKNFKNDLVVNVIRGALDLTSSQCLATLDDDNDHELFFRLYPKVLTRIYRSPLLHEKFWFLETAHVKILLPGLSMRFVRKLEKLTEHVSKKLRPGEVFSFSALKWRRTEKLYQFKKRAMKPWSNENKICDGFTIWGGEACCLQLDSRHNLVPNMTLFKETLGNDPELCT